MRLYDEDGNFSRDIEWTLEYNDLNQLTKRYVGASWSVGTHRIEYDYDDNGNLIGSVEETYSSVWSVSEEWQYDWNPRDQMTRAMKWAGSSGSTNNVGSVEYQYCLACDGALSKRFVYAGGSGASRGALQSGQRYEYDGLNLLRVDELYGSTLSEAGPWRKLEISTHQPGQLGALLHKRVYVHTNNDATPDQTKDFTYSYDPVGNVYSVFDSNGNEAYYFTQDAFGNELPITTLGGDDWDAARADRIVEHQTGKWIDEFTGLYYFHARWMDAEVGRFVGRDPSGLILSGRSSCSSCTSSRLRSPNKYTHKTVNRYYFVWGSPLALVDIDGRDPQKPHEDCLDPKDPLPPFSGPDIDWGNFCGKGTDLSKNCIPLNGMDLCCKGHDICWGKCDEIFKGRKYKKDREDCKRSCDRDLCRCAASMINPGGLLDDNWDMEQLGDRVDRHFKCDECWNLPTQHFPPFLPPPWWDDDTPFPDVW